jgi:hypothetical protein
MKNEMMTEVIFDDLHENDTVVFETTNNLYTFKLSDSKNHSGELAGGAIHRPSAAVIGGTVEEDEFLQDRLRVGGRALIYSSLPNERMMLKRIVTSPIARIRLNRAA